MHNQKKKKKKKKRQRQQQQQQQQKTIEFTRSPISTNTCSGSGWRGVFEGFDLFDLKMKTFVETGCLIVRQSKKLMDTVRIELGVTWTHIAFPGVFSGKYP
jgi:hypothetical protein